MTVSKNKSDVTQVPAKSSLNEQMLEQAKKLGIAIEELRKLAEGKKCPKYGNAELLHARRNRAGKIQVFNISERFRGEKISSSRKLLKDKKPAPLAPQPKE